MKNPKGIWEGNEGKSRFLNRSISALYGFVEFIPEDKKWYWESRTSLESRFDKKPFQGYAKTRELAKAIVEQLLYLTETVE
jgi:hypothetical protein